MVKPPYPISPRPQTRGWFDRFPRSKILVGVIAALVFLALAGCIALLVGMSAVRRSPVYQEAVANAKANPQVVSQLGEPIRPGYFISGKIRTRGRFGFADFDLPLVGPKNEGSLSVIAFRVRGQWQFRLLEVDIEGVPAIDLLPAGAAK